MRLTPPPAPEQSPHPLSPPKTGLVNPGALKAPGPASPAAGLPLPGNPPGASLPSPGTPPSPAASLGPGRPSLPPEEALARLALNLGLPREELSTALVGFVRFFSLPLDPGLLHRLRREALRPSAKSGGEALALAAAAAEAKGLRLTGEALEAYAAALDPGYRDPPEGDGRRRNPGERQNTGFPTPPDPGEIKKAAEASEAASPLLSLINPLPGKNQEQWVTLPFEFCSGGLEFKVSLRILLKTRGLYGQAERLALDIGLASRRWLFVWDKPPETAPRLDVYVTPPPAGETPLTMERELREILGDVRGNIRVKFPEKMPFFADSRDETLLSVNKEV